MIENSIDEAVLMAIEDKDHTQQSLLRALEKFYLEKEDMADETIVKIFVQQIKEYGYTMPNYCAKDKGDSFVKHLMFILEDLGHNRLQDFLHDAAKKDMYNEKNLSVL